MKMEGFLKKILPSPSNKEQSLYTRSIQIMKFPEFCIYEVGSLATTLPEHLADARSVFSCIYRRFDSACVFQQQLSLSVWAKRSNP